MRVQWTIPAKRELRDIGVTIRADNPSAAAKVVAKTRARANELRTHPGIGRIGRVEGTRELVITGTPYLIAYVVRDHVVHILTVMHGAQEWPESFDLLLASATAKANL
jgi:toxin ParE1/3/4